MRLLLVMEEEVNCGGAELSFFALCRALASRSTVDLALPAGSLENPTIRVLCESLRDTSVTVHRCRTPLNPGTISNLHRRLRRSAARELAYLIERIRPDAVVVNLPTVERGQAVVDAADLVTLRPPVWGYLHSANRPSIIGAKLGRFRDLLVPSLLARFDDLLTVSAAGAQEISTRYRMGTPEVLYPCITAIAGPPASDWERSARRAVAALTNVFLLGIVGRVDIHHKGHGSALRVTARLLEKGYPVHLVVIGDGPDLAAATRMAEQLELSGNVSFLGWRQDAGDLIPLLSAVIMPSKHEGMPLVALQAAAARVPVIGYAVDGLAEFLPQGFKVPHGDEVGLAEAVAGFARGSNLWPADEMARKGETWSNPDKAAERLLSLIRTGLETEPGRPFSRGSETFR